MAPSHNLRRRQAPKSSSSSSSSSSQCRDTTSREGVRGCPYYASGHNGPLTRPKGNIIHSVNAIVDDTVNAWATAGYYAVYDFGGDTTGELTKQFRTDLFELVCSYTREGLEQELERFKDDVHQTRLVGVGMDRSKSRHGAMGPDVEPYARVYATDDEPGDDGENSSGKPRCKRHARTPRRVDTSSSSSEEQDVDPDDYNTDEMTDPEAHFDKLAAATCVHETSD